MWLLFSVYLLSIYLLVQLFILIVFFIFVFVFYGFIYLFVVVCVHLFFLCVSCVYVYICVCVPAGGGTPSICVWSVTRRSSVCGGSTASPRSSATLRRPIRHWLPSTGSTCDVFLGSAPSHSERRPVIGCQHLPCPLFNNEPFPSTSQLPTAQC